MIDYTASMLPYAVYLLLTLCWETWLREVQAFCTAMHALLCMYGVATSGQTEER